MGWIQSTPMNHKESAWILPFERKYLGHLMASVSGRLSTIHKEWETLKAEDTHIYITCFIYKVSKAYGEMHRVSDSVNKKVGTPEKQ